VTAVGLVFTLTITLAGWPLLAVPARAQSDPAPTAWRLPPQAVVDVLDAAPTPDVDVSPDGRFLLLVERPAMPSLAEVARPWIGLAGTRVDAALSMPHGASFAHGLELREIAGGAVRRIELAPGTRVGTVSWAPDGSRFVFTVATEEGTELWRIVLPDSRPRRLVTGLNGVLGSAFTWFPDSRRLIVKLRDPARGAAPVRMPTPDAPAVQESRGVSTPLRTWQDLLSDEHDQRLFAWHAGSRVVEIDSDSGALREVLPADLHISVEPSPDATALLVNTLEPPFSYVLPWSLFPRRVEVRDPDGALLATVARVPLGDALPMEGVFEGPRNVDWAAAEPATLVWVEALDGGDPARPATARDRWFRRPAPFTEAAEELVTLTHRARGLRFLADPRQVLASEYDRDRRWSTTRLVLRGEPAAGFVVEDRNVRDRYGDPGSFATTRGPLGTRVLRQDGPWLYRVGAGAEPGGARPFLDRFNLDTQLTERLWRCAEGVHESVVAIVSSSAEALPAIVTVTESADSPPNWMLRDLAAGSVRPLTDFRDPQPALRGLQVELIRYPRRDGVELSGRLYLPADRQAGEALPALVWAYPLEYSDAATAGQSGSSPHRFARVRGASPVLAALCGYAVLDEATMPVVGPPETVNDSFLEQIAWNAEAAVEELVRRGVADPDRVAVGGHSYGAFMTANLLAHTDVFRAGIARSGAYNRTLTPFGFQSERRTLWEAPRSYLDLSPFLVAHRINEPLLLIHGEKDNNTGTFPLQSERLYQAIAGNGGIARLVMLPEESHGYRARESVLHTLAETLDWLDRFVASAEPRAAAIPTAESEELIESAWGSR